MEPVERIMRRAERSCVARGRTPRFAMASMYFAEVPKCVKRSLSAQSKRILPLRAKGEPS